MHGCYFGVPDLWQPFKIEGEKGTGQITDVSSHHLLSLTVPLGKVYRHVKVWHISPCAKVQSHCHSDLYGYACHIFAQGHSGIIFIGRWNIFCKNISVYSTHSVVTRFRRIKLIYIHGLSAILCFIGSNTTKLRFYLN